MKIRVYASTNKVGSKTERIVDLSDHFADGEEPDEETLEALAQEQMWELIEWGWEQVED